MIPPDSPMERAAVDPVWRPGSLTLDFRLGEYRLWRCPFAAVLCDGGLQLSGGRGLPSIPRALEDGTIEVALARSWPLAEWVPSVVFAPGVVRYVPSQYRRHYVDLSRGTFEDYLDGFSSKSRSTLKRKVRRCADAHGGDLVCREYRTPLELGEFLEVATGISARTYQERLLGKGLPTSGEFRERVRTLAAGNAVRGYVLFLAGRPAAYLFCPVEDGVVLYQHVGYDPVFRDVSPGTVLQYLALERLFGEGCFRVFDFTEGEGQHKELFARSHVLSADVYYFRRSLRNQAIVSAHDALRRTSRGLVSALDGLGLKGRIKRVLRARV